MHGFLVALLLGAGPDSDTRLAPPLSPTHLDGTWKLLAGDLDGAPLAGQFLVGCTITIHDQRALIECRTDGIVEAGQLDFTLDHETVRAGGNWLYGRWRLENGLLHIWVTDQSSRGRFVLYRARN